MICACSQFGTGCTSTTLQTFAPGHDSKLRKVLVDSLVDGSDVFRDGSADPVDPWAVAAEFGLTDHVSYFLQATLAKNEVLAARAAARAADSVRRDSLRAQALAIRAAREQERADTRQLAEQARQRLVESARARTQAYFDGFDWGEPDGLPEPPSSLPWS